MVAPASSQLPLAAPSSSALVPVRGLCASMRLASCAAGVTVVGIDNGYGAACAVARILLTPDRRAAASLDVDAAEQAALAASRADQEPRP